MSNTIFKVQTLRHGVWEPSLTPEQVSLKESLQRFGLSEVAALGGVFERGEHLVWQNRLAGATLIETIEDADGPGISLREP
jgi:hypothetical protein